jgi:hypothetical protein
LVLIENDTFRLSLSGSAPRKESFPACCDY